MRACSPDPQVPEWAHLHLPDSWADQLKLLRPWDLFPSRMVLARWRS